MNNELKQMPRWMKNNLLVVCFFTALFFLGFFWRTVLIMPLAAFGIMGSLAVFLWKSGAPHGKYGAAFVVIVGAIMATGIIGVLLDVKPIYLIAEAFLWLGGFVVTVYKLHKKLNIKR